MRRLGMEERPAPSYSCSRIQILRRAATVEGMADD